MARPADTLNLHISHICPLNWGCMYFAIMHEHLCVL